MQYQSSAAIFEKAISYLEVNRVEFLLFYPKPPIYYVPVASSWQASIFLYKIDNLKETASEFWLLCNKSGSEVQPWEIIYIGCICREEFELLKIWESSIVEGGSGPAWVSPVVSYYLSLFDIVKSNPDVCGRILLYSKNKVPFSQWQWCLLWRYDYTLSTFFASRQQN